MANITHRYHFQIRGHDEQLSILVTRPGDGSGASEATEDIRDATAMIYALWCGIYPDTTIREIELMDITQV